MREKTDLKSIGLFGGTFDPVHYAHTALAEAALEELDLEKVIYVPAFIQPFKRDRYVTSDQHRISMLERALNQYDKMEISLFEIEKGGISYTYDTYCYFKGLLSDYKLWFLMGTDSLMKLEGWYKGKELLKECCFAVGSRPDTNHDELIRIKEYLNKEYNTEIYLINKKMLPLSSTMVRELLLEDKPISGMVAPSVEEYIYEHRLYKD